MTDLRKAAEMALHALEFSLPAIEDFGSKEQLTDCHRAIMALYKALAQPEQEPVAWLVSDAQGRYATIRDPAPYGEEVYEPLYAAPPKREWVSLNNMDITGAAHDEAIHPVFILETTKSGLCMKFSKSGEWHCSDKNGDYMIINNFLMSFAKAIEAKLKEKNGGV